MISEVEVPKNQLYACAAILFIAQMFIVVERKKSVAELQAPAAQVSPGAAVLGGAQTQQRNQS